MPNDILTADEVRELYRLHDDLMASAKDARKDGTRLASDRARADYGAEAAQIMLRIKASETLAIHALHDALIKRGT